MSVPDFQTFFRPILEVLKDGREYRWRDIREPVATLLDLTIEDREDLVPSGAEPRYINRINWAVTYLSKAGLLISSKRGCGNISPRGLELLRGGPKRITTTDLEKFPEFLAFRNAHRKPDTQTRITVNSVSEINTSPEEQIDQLYAELSAALADDLLTQVRVLTPQQFEVLVVQLLVAMGYGGSVRDAGQALGRSGDNGIDGMIKQDPLGLDRVYLQAKRWANPVHSPEIRTFAGSLTFHRANKGVFIATSSFSDGAKSTAAQIGNIILIDGETLADLMIQYGVGVIIRTSYQIKKIDSDFFEGI